MTVSQASVSNAAFTLSGLTLPITLAAGQSTTLHGDVRTQVGRGGKRERFSEWRRLPSP